MNKIFRKVTTVLGSVALIGATIGAAAAAAYPSTFTSNTAVVYGANAASSDYSAAMNIVANLDSIAAGSSSVSLTGGKTITEDKVVLGGAVNFSTSKIKTSMTDSQFSSLLDTKINWDDGNGADDIDVHEGLDIVGNVKVLTTLDDEELKGVALSNEEGLEYRYVFEDSEMNTTGINVGDADILYLTILGKQYEISSMTNTSITVTTSEEVSLSIGESYTYGGKTFTVDDVFDGKAQINGEIVAQGNSKKIDGLKVYVDTVGYHTNAPELSKVILKVGEDISKTYTNGDEFIGQDKNDPLWTWHIVNPGYTDGYVGVKYTGDIAYADDEDAGDTIKYIGEGYMFPNNFAQITLDGLTEVGYEVVSVSFDTVNLYNTTYSDPITRRGEVVKISAENTDTITVNSIDTDEIYIFYAKEGSEAQTAAANGTIEVYFRDHNGEYTPTNQARYAKQFDLGVTNNLTRAQIGTITVGDTVVDIDFAVLANGNAMLYFENPDNNDIAVNVSGTAIAQAAGSFTKLGATLAADDVNDVVVSTKDVSSIDEGEIMDTYGIIVSKGTDPESEIDKDKLTISVPDEQVYGIVSVTAGGEATDGGEAGALIVKDSETSSISGKNLIVVGGSAINSVAADLLGGVYSEAAFTAQTGVDAGKFLIQSFNRNGKTALLVAGYNAADTEKASTYLLNNAVDTTVGKKYIGTSSTEATLVVQ